jgi:hypothetical protein
MTEIRDKRPVGTIPSPISPLKFLPAIFFALVGAALFLF